MKKLLAALRVLDESNGSPHLAGPILQAYRELLKVDPDLEQDVAGLTFEEHTACCVRLLVERPETADFKAVYAEDAEGNGFDAVFWAPTVGKLEGSDYIQEVEFEESDEPNAVCIN